MTFNKIVNACFVLCITAILWIALCGCDDLGAYEDTTEYYNSFDDIVLISGTSKSKEIYSVEDYFYNEESREDFLTGEDGAYKGVAHSDYVYMAIPFENDIEMDTLALYLQSKSDATVYINVYVTDKIPENWKAIADNLINKNSSGGTTGGETGATAYDDPDPKARIGEITLHLKKENWGSFVLDLFTVDGIAQKSIQIKEGQYILLQIRNNSGVRIFDNEKNVYVDEQTGLELEKVDITMTNLLIRAVSVNSSNKEQGGEE